MIGLFWNARGLNGPPKSLRVQELIKAHCPDFICISKIEKIDFSLLQLEALDSKNGYCWKWLPAVDTAGGILIGLKDDTFEILSCDIHIFCVSCILRCRNNNKTGDLSLFMVLLMMRVSLIL